ncbi:MAG: hypothetical protein WD078_05265 [Woeseia sp.]
MGRIGAVFLYGFLLAAGCGNGLSGSYADETGVTRYEFQSGGRARISVLGSTVNAEYTLDGDKVLVTSPQGTVVLKRDGDRLYGPMGLELLRQPH